MKIAVDKTKCPQNHVCPATKICPVNAIKQKGHEAPEIEYDLCINCKKCVKFCPLGALQEIQQSLS